MADNELIGIVGAHEQRAYSTWQLDRHEIVNGVFEGRSIAVTWYPLCGTGIVHDRVVGGRTLTFGVSGMLLRDSLVMYDRQTDTLWTQVDGRGVGGPHRGRQLQIVPAVHATWKEWRTLYPNTRVLKKRGEFRGSTWDISTGRASSCSMKGAQLTPSSAYPAFWFGWREYFPATGVWHASARPAQE